MLCSANEFNTLPITLPNTVPTIPPTIGGRLNVFATVVPNAPNVAGVTKLVKAVLDCCVLASTIMMLVDWQKGQLKLIARLLNFEHKKACSMADFVFIFS